MLEYFLNNQNLIYSIASKFKGDKENEKRTIIIKQGKTS